LHALKKLVTLQAYKYPQFVKMGCFYSKKSCRCYVEKKPHDSRKPLKLFFSFVDRPEHAFTTVNFCFGQNSGKTRICVYLEVKTLKLEKL